MIAKYIAFNTVDNLNIILFSSKKRNNISSMDPSGVNLGELV